MYTCVLIPKSLSLVLTLHPNQANFMEMSAAVWSNVHLSPGTLLYPDDGELRMDKLEVYRVLDENDIRRKHGCDDVIQEVEGLKVRHCNWVRFVKDSTDTEKVNVISSKVKGHCFFQVIKPIKPNEELVVLFHTENTDVTTTDLGTQHISSAGTNNSSKVSITFRIPDCSNEMSTDDDETKSLKNEDHNPSKFETEGEPALETKVNYSAGSSISDALASDNSLHHLTESEQSPIREERMISEETQENLLCPVDSVRTLLSPDFPSPKECMPGKRARVRTWWSCDVCTKKFDRPSLLKRHIRTHTGEKPHACDLCGKAFSTSSSLNTHRRIHSGEKPHQCPVCGKRFTASSNLYYHRMTHNKDKPHKCTLCSKSFPTPGDLRSHMYVHSGSWPYRCHVCNRGFSKHTNLKNHELLHSGDKPHECQRCGKKFALSCNLKTHQKTHEANGSCVKCGMLFSEHVTEMQHGVCKKCSRVPDTPKEKQQRIQKRKSAVTNFSISKLTSQVEESDKKGKSLPDFQPATKASSSQVTSPYERYYSQQGWLHPFPTAFTPTPAMTCMMKGMTSLPDYAASAGKAPAPMSGFLSPDILARGSIIPPTHTASHLYYANTRPIGGSWMQQAITHGFFS